MPKGQSEMDNPENLTTYGTQGEDKQNKTKQSKNKTQYVLDTTIRNQCISSFKSRFRFPNVTKCTRNKLRGSV